MSVETIETWEDGRRQSWRKVRARAEESFVLAADLGQSQDPTALSVLRYSATPLDEWKTTIGRVNVNTQQVAHRFDVVFIERLPLGTSYPDIVSYVGMLMQRAPLTATETPFKREAADLVIDETGVGRAVGDMFDAAGLHPIRVTITSGMEASGSGHQWHVPKGLLVSTLDAKLHSGELRFAKDLADGHALADELKDFQRSVSAAGRQSYSARAGRHDDLVLSVAIATWWASERRSHNVFSGTVEGMF